MTHSEPSPPQTAALLPRWVKRASALAHDMHIQALAEELHTLGQRIASHNLSIGVFGEVRRGKTTLINALLQRQVMPAGYTTPVPVALVSGEQERVTLKSQAHTLLDQQLKEVQWPDILTGSIDHHASLHITLRQDWLKRHNVTLFDTPATGNLTALRQQRVAATLRQCDVVILVVSALIPFSKSERTFLEQEMLGNNISRIIVAISFLDKLPEAERQRTLTYIQQQMHGVDPLIPVVTTMSFNGGSLVHKLREQLEEREKRTIRTQWHSAQVAMQLVAPLTQMITLCQVGELDAPAQQALLHRLQDDEQHFRSQWHQLEVTSRPRRDLAVARLTAQISGARGIMIDHLTYSLQKESVDPHHWLNEDLPYVLQRELTAIGQTLALSFSEEAIDHLRWYRQALELNGSVPEPNRTFAVPLRIFDIDEVINSHQPRQKPVDTERWQWYLRIGNGAITVIGALIQGPVGVAMAAGFELLGEQMLRAIKTNNRQQLQAFIPTLVDAALQAYAAQIAERYHAQVHWALQRLWQQDQLWNASLGQSPQALPGQRQRLLHEAQQLQQEILNTLQLG